jgi:hypothetical protein
VTLTEIASRIDAHLKRIEADPNLNPWHHGEGSTKSYYNAYAVSAGPYVMVTYVTYQGRRGLKRAEAEAYLAWLDEGHVGKHFERQQRAKSP